MVSKLVGEGAMPLPAPASHAELHRVHLHRGVTKLKQDPLLARFNLFFLFFNLSAVFSKSSSWSRFVRNSSKVLVVAFNSWRKSMENMSAELVTIDRSSRSRSAKNSSAELAVAISTMLVDFVFIAFNPWNRSKESMSAVLVHPSSIAIPRADPMEWKQFRGAVAEIDPLPPSPSQPNFVVKKHLRSKPCRRIRTHFVLDLQCLLPPLLRECAAVIEACSEYVKIINTGNQYISNTQSKYSSAESSDCKSFAKLFEVFFDKLTDMPGLLPRTTPSVVAYTKNGDRLVGQIAKRQAVVNPENTFFSVKSFIGRKMAEVDEESKQVSYNVIRDENGNVKLDCLAIGKQFADEEIPAQVLRKLVAAFFVCPRPKGVARQYSSVTVWMHSAFIWASKEILDLETELSLIKSLLSTQATLVHNLADHLAGICYECKDIVSNIVDNDPLSNSFLNGVLNHNLSAFVQPQFFWLNATEMQIDVFSSGWNLDRDDRRFCST
nr:stromal 70 kDa heat shock-related protein, chloroplastic [Ipomoea batatas]